MRNAMQRCHVTRRSGHGQLTQETINLVNETLQDVGNDEVIIANRLAYPVNGRACQTHPLVSSCRWGASVGCRDAAAVRSARTSSLMSIGLLT